MKIIKIFHIVQKKGKLILITLHQNLTQKSIQSIIIRFHLEHQIINQEKKDSGRKIDKIMAMTMFSYKNY